MDYLKTHFIGERALFKTSNASIKDCLFDDGESPLKESHDFKVEGTTFGWKYPCWYSHDFEVKDSTFTEFARAGVWYSYGFKIHDCAYIAPKGIRMCHDFVLANLNFENGLETLWWNHDFTLDNITAKGDYFCMRCVNMVIRNLKLTGNYCFDTCRNLTIEDSILDTKDAFWNCENVVVRNCVIKGEYFGWNSRNVTLIDCKISSHQGFCYMDNVKLINCDLMDTDLCFEYCSNIEASITSRIASVKNPISGKIICKGIDELIEDDDSLDHTKTEYVVA